MNPLPMVLADLRAMRWSALLSVVLVALAVAIGVAVGAQERALRQASARAADDFPIVIGAAGSPTQLVLTSVYLRPDALTLIDGQLLNRLAADPRVAGVAPIAFGDVVRGYPVVGTTADLVTRWGRLKPAEGRIFAAEGEAVVGSEVAVALGDSLEPSHAIAGHVHQPGVEDEEEHAHRHAGVHYRVVGRLPRLGSPWDRAILIPVESVWETHGLGDGHGAAAESDHDHDHEAGPARVSDTAAPAGAASGERVAAITTAAGPLATGTASAPGTTGALPGGAAPAPATTLGAAADAGHDAPHDNEHGARRLGPPFEAAKVPGVPALVVKPRQVFQAYQLRTEYRKNGLLAVFPAEVLVALYATVGDVRDVLVIASALNNVLVFLAIVMLLLTLTGLRRRRYAILRALGASQLYVALVVWLGSAVLLASGAIAGLGVGWIGAEAVARLVAARTGLSLAVTLSGGEIRLALAMAALGSLVAVVPAVVAWRRPVGAALRS
jgi:putative ABC transport system permease protein